MVVTIMAYARQGREPWGLGFGLLEATAGTSVIIRLALKMLKHNLGVNKWKNRDATGVTRGVWRKKNYRSWGFVGVF
jgi:hypothetical protein